MFLCLAYIRATSARSNGGAMPQAAGGRKGQSLLPGRSAGSAVVTEEELLAQRCSALSQLYRMYKVPLQWRFI